ncbi:N-acetyltransferase family protein [Streptomyces sp. NPDC004230]
MISDNTLRELDSRDPATADALLTIFQVTTMRHRLQVLPDAEVLHSQIQPRTTSDRRVIAAFDESGAAVAYALVTRNRLANRSLADLDIRVLPDHGRRGYGTALLDAAHQIARELGCDRLVADIPAVPAGTSFAEKHGGKLTYQHQRTVLELRKIDIDRYLSWAGLSDPDGKRRVNEQYTTVRWTDHCPDHLVQAHIVARGAMHDEPTGDLVKEKNLMTPAELRQLEDARIAYGQRRHTVAALAPNGDMAAFTQIAIVKDSTSPLAPMGNTAVVEEHRGRRLALRLKAELALWMLECEPHIELVDCWNNVDNKAMTHTNQVLGWQVTGASNAYTFQI